MSAKMKALLMVVVVLGGVAGALYLPTLRPVNIQAGADEHANMPGEQQKEQPVKGQSRDSRVPVKLAGMGLAGAPITGPEAKDHISQLHGVGISIMDGYMAAYSDGKREAMLWVSISANDQDAGLLLGAMDRKMPASKVFTGHSVKNIAGKPYHFVRGEGLDNYYWQQGKSVVWLGLMNVDAKGLDEVIRATREAVKIVGLAS